MWRNLVAFLAVVGGLIACQLLWAGIGWAFLKAGDTLIPGFDESPWAVMMVGTSGLVVTIWVIRRAMAVISPQTPRRG